MPYHVGDSVASVARAGREGHKGIDVNMHSTSDLVAVAKHWGDPAHKGDDFTHLWTGPEHGQGDLIPDPHPSHTISQRPWQEVKRLTDKSGKQRIARISEHFAEGVKHNVLVMPEAKGGSLMDRPEFWERLGAEADAVGHPRVMMTLPNIGNPVQRLTAAKGAGFQTAVLPGTKENPRMRRPSTYATRWDPVTDRLWGTGWGKP